MQRRARCRAAERRQRPGAGHAVGGEARPRLEAAQRGVGVRAEAAVERAGREAVGGEQELQRRDIPAAGAERQRPAPEPRAPAAAERAARARADHAVDGEAAAALELLHRGDGRRARHAVDAAGVEAAGAQRHLEGGDVGRRVAVAVAGAASATAARAMTSSARATPKPTDGSATGGRHGRDLAHTGYGAVA